jgi:hypothetical protein
VVRCRLYTPFLATLLVVFIVGSMMSTNVEVVSRSGWQIISAVFTLHSSGFALGYFISKAMGLSDKICRTNSIEVRGGVTAGEGSACVYKVRMCPSFGWLAARQVAWMEVLGAVVLSEGHSRMLPCTPAIDCVVPRLCLLLQLQQHLCGMPLLG